MRCLFGLVLGSLDVIMVALRDSREREALNCKQCGCAFVSFSPSPPAPPPWFGNGRFFVQSCLEPMPSGYVHPQEGRFFRLQACTARKWPSALVCTILIL